MGSPIGFERDFNHLRIIGDLVGRKVSNDDKVHADDVGINNEIIKDAKSGPRYVQKRFGVALFGLGRIGMIHFLNIVKEQDIDLLYCVEYDEQRLNYVSFKFNLNAKMLKPEQQEQVFNDPKVDVVVICTPTQAHEELVLKALKAGKAVLCEKPLAFCTGEEGNNALAGKGASSENCLNYNHDGISRCYDFAEKAGKTLFCAFNRRFDPTFNEIKRRVDNGEIGDIHVVKTCSRDSPRPTIDYLKTSGGIYHDCAVHDLDMVCWIMGEYPTSVSSVAHSFDKDIKEIDDFDTVAITLKFPSGGLGLIDLSRASNYGYDQRVEVFGNKGMLTSGDLRPTTLEFNSNLGSVKNPICYSFTSRYIEGYALELQHFLKEVKGNRQSVITRESVLKISELASACEKSAREGITVNIPQ